MLDIDEEVLSRPVLKQRQTKAQIEADNAAAAEKKSMKAEETKSNNDELQAKRVASHPLTKKSIVLVLQPPGKHTKTHLFKCM
jgi:hypothetical protein